MREIRPCPTKNHDDLTREWDRLAEERHRQIASGEDLSFEHVIVPTAWQLLEGADSSLVLDVGAGTGEFTARLARVAGRVIAVEPSSRSMAVARRVCRDAPNVRFVVGSLEETASRLDEGPVTAAVAVMTLMTAPDIRELAKALAALLQIRARFVATLTHPWFWPKYWGYEEESWFRYEAEIFIEAPFVISRCHTQFRTTHVHRPLERYLSVFAEEGFRLEALTEPMPAVEVQALYPAPWRFPRFLGLRWEKVV
jgi:SAM-dependent methyltransferase